SIFGPRLAKGGITPLGKPGTVYAPGSAIDSCVYCWSVPRFAFFASAARLSRSGPTLPAAPAGLNVWHDAQPFAAKSALPAEALPLGAGAGDGPGLGAGDGAVVAAAVVVSAVFSFDSRAKPITAPSMPTKKTTATAMKSRSPR